MTAPPLLDRAVLDDLIEHLGLDPIRSVVKLFLDESRGYFETIAKAAAPGSDPASRDRARRAAHALKSGAGQLGASAIAAAANAVEEAAGRGAPDLPARIAALEAYAENTRAALLAVIGEQDAPGGAAPRQGDR